MSVYRFNPRWLIGRTITEVEMNYFATGIDEHPHNEHPITTDPTIYFDNGARLGFIVAETEIGEYGVEFVYTPAPKQRRRATRGTKQ